MHTNLEFRRGMITGNVAGKLLNSYARPSLPGSEPAPGLYQILPPVSDVIYGLLAMMVPAGSPVAPGGLTLQGISDRSIKTPLGVSGKVDSPSGISDKALAVPGGVSGKAYSPNSISDKASAMPGGASAKWAPGDISGKASAAPGGASAKWAPGDVSGKASAVPGGASAKWAPGGRSDKASAAPGGISLKVDSPSSLSNEAAAATPSFVLCSRPIPGRYCLVIQSGLADLMDALHSAGGASVLIQAD